MEPRRPRRIRLVSDCRPRYPANRKDLAIDIIESEIRSAIHEVWLEAAKLVLTDAEPLAIARHLRELAQRTITPKPRSA